MTLGSKAWTLSDPSCANIVFTLVDTSGAPLSSIFSFNGDDIEVSTISDSDVGVYNLRLQGYLDDYPSITDEVDFTVHVISCGIATVTASSISDKRFALGSSKIFTFSEFDSDM